MSFAHGYMKSILNTISADGVRYGWVVPDTCLNVFFIDYGIPQHTDDVMNIVFGLSSISGENR